MSEEPALVESLAYRREVTNRAERHGWREKDVAYNVAYLAAVRAALEQKEEIA